MPGVTIGDNFGIRFHLLHFFRLVNAAPLNGKFPLSAAVGCQQMFPVKYPLHLFGIFRRSCRLCTDRDKLIHRSGFLATGNEIMPASEIGVSNPLCVFEAGDERRDITLAEAVTLITRLSLRPTVHPRLGTTSC